MWITVVDRKTALNRTKHLESIPVERRDDYPLYGFPFSVKDNIDVAGVPTTAACPDFAYTPDQSSTVVDRLEAAGAIFIGKTNLDQFATGLVGTRTPMGRHEILSMSHSYPVDRVPGRPFRYPRSS